MEKVSIELDVIFDDSVDTPQTRAESISKVFNVEAELVAEFAPGSGWPVIRFTAEYGAMYILLYWYCGGCDQTVQDYLGYLEAVA